ncbi:hypothetical protein [Calycomorphotria hydatis]|uniref:Uncharacterized protein n=1 Tax=Calycomorphotria hydatis TaxID=2528027 RepID=A0A517TC86_9PLAN|nr:hypothetical protein [Calycomorphotria hydatis]QDT65984.1 hypothetical protein V22_32480 [Calycomorphotria hydatis]
MNRSVLFLTAIVVLLVSSIFYAELSADPPAAPHSGRYDVISTDGSNLIVTDEATNTLYFYVIDEGAKIGDDLKLRGSINLNEVGQESIRPMLREAKGAAVE